MESEAIDFLFFWEKPIADLLAVKGGWGDRRSPSYGEIKWVEREELWLRRLEREAGV